MPETYARRQLLLRREDNAPAGFVRFERVGNRVTVTLRAQGVGREARALLMHPGGGEPRALGALKNGEAQYTLSPEEAEGYTQAAVLSADKLLLLGGEGADFKAARRELAKPKARPAPKSAAAPSPLQGERDVFPDGRSAKRAESPPAAPKAAEAAPLDGWIITPDYAPGAPERIRGRLLKDGVVVARLDGVAGVYAPEPPPGLTGYSWDAGFWVHVEAAEG